MTANKDKIPSLAAFPAFRGCSESTIKRIHEEGILEKFNIGHALSTASIIPNRVLLIVEGQARLLGQHQGKLSSIALLGPGNFIGLPSLLRGEACEEVGAATSITALSIPDTLISYIYSSEDSFRAWCNSTVFLAEVCSLLREPVKQTNKAPFEIRDILEEAFPLAQTFLNDDDLKKAYKESFTVYLSSNNSEKELNSVINADQQIPSKSGVFDLRFIGFPSELVKRIRDGRSSEINIPEQTILETDELATIPSRTTLNLSGGNPRDSLVLIKGEGSFQESIACFKMLSQLLDIPFRRDSIEKSLRSVLNKGIEPSLPMFGELVTSMGLLATGAKIGPSLCTRLNVPCLLEWIDGWSVVVRSDARGFLIANPRKGWIELSPEEISDKAPDGLNVLLVERTKSSPEKNFDFGWFLPAIKRYQSTLLLVLASSFVVQLFTLANPLLIQVIIDKVISQRSLDTLQVLGIALVAVTLFEGVLSSLRTFLFTDTTNRIDMRLGTEVIDHLLRLPVGYFDKRPVGELGTRIAELEKIRNFLTGEALTTIIDAAFSVIYIFVMALYSWVLTIVALLVVPIQVAITFIGAPILDDNIANQQKLTQRLNLT